MPGTRPTSLEPHYKKLQNSLRYMKDEEEIYSTRQRMAVLLGRGRVPGSSYDESSDEAEGDEEGASNDDDLEEEEDEEEEEIGSRGGAIGKNALQREEVTPLKSECRGEVEPAPSEADQAGQLATNDFLHYLESLFSKQFADSVKLDLMTKFTRFHRFVYDKLKVAGLDETVTARHLGSPTELAAFVETKLQGCSVHAKRGFVNMHRHLLEFLLCRCNEHDSDTRQLLLSYRETTMNIKAHLAGDGGQRLTARSVSNLQSDTSVNAQMAQLKPGVARMLAWFKAIKPKFEGIKNNKHGAVALTPKVTVHSLAFTRRRGACTEQHCWITNSNNPNPKEAGMAAALVQTVSSCEGKPCRTTNAKKLTKKDLEEWRADYMKQVRKGGTFGVLVKAQVHEQHKPRAHTHNHTLTHTHTHTHTHT
jgi:hypothetical protein